MVAASSPFPVWGTWHWFVERAGRHGHWEVLEAEQSYVDAAGKPTKGQSYKGLHVILRSPGGVVCEVQVHSAEAMAAKHDTHAEYELERDDEAPLVQRAAARATSEKRWAGVKAPADLDGLVELGGVPVKPKTDTNPYRTLQRRDAP